MQFGPKFLSPKSADSGVNLLSLGKNVTMDANLHSNPCITVISSTASFIMHSYGKQQISATNGLQGSYEWEPK